MGNRPDWQVVVATDDGRAIYLTINQDTGQLYLGVSESQRAPTHVATFNRKTQALANLVDGLIEASEQLGAEVLNDDGADRCSNPGGHEWNRTAGEADEARLAGDVENDNVRCVHCGADGDA